eukprot:TRINITY_DN884_c0_g2_i3.p1 TRINITY_DN884_c0_g2~~TRINITY_DN884_c0_g2_i3.p1  ORF type:complete len:1271 (-),score=211.25 TRINITY_DN884_c0_g2_i3:1445-5257(-)
MFWGRQFRDITADCCFSSPVMLHLRAKIIQYFESTWVSKARKLFSTPMEIVGSHPVLVFKQDCVEHQLFQAILKAKDNEWQKKFPRNVIPNLRNAHPKMDESAPELWRAIVWYFFTESTAGPEYLTDWSQYRDLAYWSKLCLVPNWSTYSELEFSARILQIPFYPEIVEKQRDSIKVANGFPASDDTKPSLANPCTLFSNTKDGKTVITEETLLEQPSLPTFESALTEEESLKLLSLMTAPYIRIPLILSFFAKDHVESLLCKKLRHIMETTVFTTGRFSETPAKISSVPARNPESLGVRFGLLVQELSTSPDSTLLPLLSLLHQIVDLTNENKLFFRVLLLLVRMSTRIIAYYSWIEEGKFSYMQPSSFEFKNTELISELKIFLSNVVLPILIQHTVEKKEFPTKCFKIHQHIALICALDLDNEFHVKHLLCSFAHTSTWISSCLQNKWKVKKRVLWSFPLVDVFSLQHALRTKLLAFSSQNPKMKEISQQMVHCSTYHHLYYETQTGREKEEKTEEENKNEIKEQKEDEMFQEELDSWHAFKIWKPEYNSVWESQHPMIAPVTLSHKFHFPGAKEITLTFHPQFEIHYFDIIITSTLGWGPVTLSENKIPSLLGGQFRVPVNEIELYLKSKGDIRSVWGLHVTATAMVSDEIVARLQANFDESQKNEGIRRKATEYMCQRALCDSQSGGEAEALKYLIENFEKLEHEANFDKTPGLFRNGKYCVDLQSFMVSLTDQEQIPTPCGLNTPSTSAIFQDSLPSVCYLREAHQNMKLYEMTKDDVEYRLEHWNEVDLEDAGESELDYFQSVPVITEHPNEKKAFATYLGETYVHYNRGTCGWASYLLDNFLAEKLKYSSVVPEMYFFDVGQLRTFVNKTLLLTKEHPTISFLYCLSSNRRELPQWYEVHVLPERKILEFFLIFNSGRMAQRHLLATMDQSYSMRFVPPEKSSISLNAPRIPEFQKAMGCSWNALNFCGFQSGINWFCPFWSVIVTRRKKKSGSYEKSVWEEYIPAQFLESLIPEALCKDLNFWKSGNIICGETQKGNQLLEVELLGNGKAVVRKPGYLDNIKENDNEEKEYDEDYEQNKVPETLTLLNLHGEPVGTKFDKFAKLFQNLEAWSGVLMWTKSNPKPGEDAEISEIQLPRLNVSFTMVRVNQDDTEISETENTENRLPTEEKKSVSILACMTDSSFPKNKELMTTRGASLCLSFLSWRTPINNSHCCFLLVVLMLCLLLLVHSITLCVFTELKIPRMSSDSLRTICILCICPNLT